VITRAHSHARSGGFTLLELLIALAIVGALLAIAFGGLRVALSSWTRGEERAEFQQHARGIAQIVGRAVGAAYPYRGVPGTAPDTPTTIKPILFVGSENKVELVTQAAPFPFDIPSAFTALVIAVEDDPELGRALVIRQRALPNREPFAQATVVLRDPLIQSLELRYLGADNTWVDSWDGDAEQGLPPAISIRFATQRDGKLEPSPPMTVSLRTMTIQ